MSPVREATPADAISGSITSCRSYLCIPIATVRPLTVHGRGLPKQMLNQPTIANVGTIVPKHPELLDSWITGGNMRWIPYAMYGIQYDIMKTGSQYTPHCLLLPLSQLIILYVFQIFCLPPPRRPCGSLLCPRQNTRTGPLCLRQQQIMPSYHYNTLSL